MRPDVGRRDWPKGQFRYSRPGWPEPRLKFDKIYERYSQRFHREDFDEDERFNPQGLARFFIRPIRSRVTHSFISAQFSG
jgi:curved DNA-binding protein CbpA